MPRGIGNLRLNVYVKPVETPSGKSTIAYSVYSGRLEGVYTERVTAEVSGTLVIPDFIRAVGLADLRRRSGADQDDPEPALDRPERCRGACWQLREARPGQLWPQPARPAARDAPPARQLL